MDWSNWSIWLFQIKYDLISNVYTIRQYFPLHVYAFDPFSCDFNINFTVILKCFFLPLKPNVAFLQHFQKIVLQTSNKWYIYIYIFINRGLLQRPITSISEVKNVLSSFRSMLGSHRVNAYILRGASLMDSAWSPRPTQSVVYYLLNG